MEESIYPINFFEVQERSVKMTENYISRKAIKERIEKEIVDYDKKIQNIMDENNILNKVILVLTESSNTARRIAKTHFEKIITEAL